MIEQKDSGFLQPGTRLVPEGTALEILQWGCGIGCSNLVALLFHASAFPSALFAFVLLHEYRAPGGDGDRPVNRSGFFHCCLGLLRPVRGD